MFVRQVGNKQYMHLNLTHLQMSDACLGADLTAISISCSYIAQESSLSPLLGLRVASSMTCCKPTPYYPPS